MIRDLLKDTLTALECNDPQQPVIKRTIAALSGCDEAARSFDCLAPRQMEIAVLAAKGFNDREIADMLGVSAKTVSPLRHKAMEKVGVDSIAQLAVQAYRGGLLGDGNP